MLIDAIAGIYIVNKISELTPGTRQIEKLVESIRRRIEERRRRQLEELERKTGIRESRASGG